MWPWHLQLPHTMVAGVGRRGVAPVIRSGPSIALPAGSGIGAMPSCFTHAVQLDDQWPC